MAMSRQIAFATAAVTAGSVAQAADGGARFRRVARRELIFRAATLRVVARRCSKLPTMVANDAVR